MWLAFRIRFIVVVRPQKDLGCIFLIAFCGDVHFDNILGTRFILFVNSRVAIDDFFFIFLFFVGHMCSLSFRHTNVTVRVRHSNFETSAIGTVTNRDLFAQK